MKKILILLAFSLPIITQAKIIRVNNSSGIQADYASLQMAVDSASASDTIMVEASPNTYGAVTVNKKLYIYGPGYFLGQNPQTQANPTSAKVSSFTFTLGSAGSMLTGMEVETLLTVSDDNIIIKRNLVHYQGIYITGRTNVMIIQNYIIGTYGSGAYAGVYLAAGSSNIFISNNYINFYNSFNSINMVNTSSATITNNILATNLNIQNATFDNNIILAGTITQTNCALKNNLSNSTQLDTLNGNQPGVVMTNVFVGLTGNSTDGQWKLKAGSPAIGAGVSGEDCGIFGTIDPYKLSGVPSIPSIYFFSAPSTGSASQGLPVRIKIKSNK